MAKEAWTLRGSDGKRHNVSMSSVTIGGEVMVNVKIIPVGGVVGTSAWYEGPSAVADALAGIVAAIGCEPMSADWHLPV